MFPDFKWSDFRSPLHRTWKAVKKMSHIGKAKIKKLTDHNWRSLCLEVDHQLTSLGGKLRPGGDRHESGLNFETCFQNESNLRGSNPLPRSDERRFLVANFHQAFLYLEQKKKFHRSAISCTKNLE